MPARPADVASRRWTATPRRRPAVPSPGGCRRRSPRHCSSSRRSRSTSVPSIAVLLFDGSIGGTDGVSPQTVAWFRAIGAAIALLAVSRGWRSGWTREQLIGVAFFGITTVLMNVFFYLGDRAHRPRQGHHDRVHRPDRRRRGHDTQPPQRDRAAVRRRRRGGARWGRGRRQPARRRVHPDRLGAVGGLHRDRLACGPGGPRRRRARARPGDRRARHHTDRRPGQPRGLDEPHAARPVPGRRRVLQRHRIRHRSVHDAPDPDPPVLPAPRAAPRDGDPDRLDRARPATLGHRPRSASHSCSSGWRSRSATRSSGSRRSSAPTRPDGRRRRRATISIDSHAFAYRDSLEDR